MIDLPKGPFDIIYADPPWPHRGNHLGGKPNVDSHYPIMTIKAICAMPVAACAADNSLLFLWTTGQHLIQAGLVGDAWGFEYATAGFVWDKRKSFVGNYTNSQVEFCLLFRRGGMLRPKDFKVDQFLSEKRGGHSAKPLEIRRRIERMYPTQRKLELFARQPCDGWTVWGNQANGERIRAQVVEKQEELL